MSALLVAPKPEQKQKPEREQEQEPQPQRQTFWHLGRGAATARRADNNGHGDTMREIPSTQASCFAPPGSNSAARTV